MDTNSQTSSNKEIRYLRFLNNTLQIREIRKDICDEFTRKIFDFLEDDPLFDAQVFCALIYKFIFKCKLYRGLVMTAETNIYDKIRLNAGKIANELSLFLSLSSVNFALSSVNPNQFHNISLKEKLDYLLERDKPSLITDDESKSILATLSKKNNPLGKQRVSKLLCRKCAAIPALFLI